MSLLSLGSSSHLLNLFAMSLGLETTTWSALVHLPPPHVEATLTLPGVVCVCVLGEASPARSFGLEVKKQSAAQTHTSLPLSPSQSVSLQHCHNLSAIKLAALLSTQNVCQRNQQLGCNCYHLIMLTFLWHIGPVLYYRRGEMMMVMLMPGRVDKLHPFTSPGTVIYCEMSTFVTWPSEAAMSPT